MPPTSTTGIAGTSVDDIAERVLTAWDDFLDLARAADLDRPSRLRGWTARQMCLHLGTWDDWQPLAGVLDSARSGARGAPFDQRAGNDRVVAAHDGADDGQVLAALERSRDEVAAFLGSPEAEELGECPAVSPLGRLPVLAIVHGGCYELAVHGLDLAPAGAPAPPHRLLDAGLAAVVDVTGALAARHQVHLAVTAQAPEGGWRFDAHDGGWSTEPSPAGRVEGTAVLGSAQDLLDVSAGRAHVPPLLVSKRLHVQELGAFLRLAPLVREVPGLPGGAALRRAAHAVSGMGGLAGRLGRWGRLGR